MSDRRGRIQRTAVERLAKLDGRRMQIVNERPNRRVAHAGALRSSITVAPKVETHKAVQACPIREPWDVTSLYIWATGFTSAPRNHYATARLGGCFRLIGSYGLTISCVALSGRLCGERSDGLSYMRERNRRREV